MENWIHGYGWMDVCVCRQMQAAQAQCAHLAQLPTFGSGPASPTVTHSEKGGKHNSAKLCSHWQCTLR
eukprot:365274-Chlamydomonas_euryale.AAC.5